MNLRLLVTVGGILLCSTPAFAEKTNPFYVGLGAGGVEYSRDGDNDSPHPESEKSNPIFHVFGGYNLTDWLAVELDYADYGEVPPGRSYTTFPGNAIPLVPLPSFTEQMSVDGISLSALAKYPLHRSVEPFLRFGVSHVAASTTVIRRTTSIPSFIFPDGPFSPAVEQITKKTHTDSSDEILLGVGSDLKLSQHLSARFEWTYINNVKDYDLSAFSLGMIWNF